MNPRFLRIHLAIAVLALLATISRADIAFSDLPATAPYYVLGGYLVVGATANLGNSLTVGAQFTASTSGGIDALLLGLTKGLSSRAQRRSA
jgi:hypothetical protein